MGAVVELVVTASTRAEAAAALAAEARAINTATAWDNSDTTCRRILSWLRARQSVDNVHAPTRR